MNRVKKILFISIQNSHYRYINIHCYLLYYGIFYSFELLFHSLYILNYELIANIEL
jgi:hypothetical protein